MDNTTPTDQAASGGPDIGDVQRRLMVDALALGGGLSSDAEAALRAVPRHAFAPGASLEAVYHLLDPVVVKRNRYGSVVSSMPAMQTHAAMLDQAAVKDGMAVWEVGSGGCNAALIRELAGADGRVVTSDIDCEITERAARLLSDTGYHDVRVVCADAADPLPGNEGLFDRIIVTAAAWDLPTTWSTHLAEGGRLVVPLTMRGLTRSVAFDLVDDHLESVSMQPCRLEPMRGAAAHQPELLLLHNTVCLWFDDGLPAAPELTDSVVESERTEVWTGVPAEWRDPADTLPLYLASVLDGFCRLELTEEHDLATIAPALPSDVTAVTGAGSLAYLTTRSAPGLLGAEFGVHAVGPERQILAETVAGHVRDWHRRQRGGPGPHIRVYPAGTPDEQLPADGRVIDKIHCRIVLTWPTKTATSSMPEW
ncbi:methyltransferase, FxLD system [Streptomyces luteireticuli]|uniref:methyltransferase, FxLD system n=1 Tax=Streptomyces luteireticuli TaxID=173858 RepID=UPI0035569969